MNSPFARAFIAALFAASFITVAHAQRAAPVGVDEIIMQPFAQTVPLLGELVAKQSGAVAARIDGTVAAMHVQVGDRVARGQALATLDKAELELRLALVRAQYDEAVAREQSAAAQLTLASQEVKRLSGLSRQDAVSRASIDDADQQQNIAGARLRESRAAVARASAALQLAALERDYATVLAPFAGGITETLSEVGGYLRRGDAVVKMVSERRMEIEAAVPAQYLGGAVIGADVQVVVGAQTYRATVRAVVAEEERRTRTRRVRLVADALAQARADANFAAQQSVTLLMPAGVARDIVSVHKDAIIQRGADKIVFIVIDGAAQLRPIKTGAASGDRIEVLQGLQPGELAVVRGNERLQPNQPVMIAPLQ